MPDIERKTISATETPSLWNASPYLTRWMLWHKFHDNMDVSSPENPRMDWGLKMQPLVLAVAADELKMEVIPNHDDTYLRRGLLGCTRDADVICPDRGQGAFETKCVFDYRTWVTSWASGETPPKHYELQLQQQMYVGDGVKPFAWGVLSAWVAGEMHYFERKPIPELWAEMEREAEAFFESLKTGQEPDPFGVAIELPFLTAVERIEEEVEYADADLARYARQLADARDDAKGCKQREDEAKVKLLAAMGSATRMKLPGGVFVNAQVSRVASYVVKDQVRTTLKVKIPEED